MAEEKKNPFLDMDDEQLRELAVKKGLIKGTSKTESFARGVAQGASLGFADEIAAGVESAVSDKSYEESLEESRQAYKRAETDNPVTYNAGDVGGSIAGAVALPGGFAAKTAGNVALGAVNQLGRSEDKQASDLVAGGAIGAIADVAGRGAGKILKKAGSGIAKSLERAQKNQIFEAMGAKTSASLRNMRQKLGKKGITGQKEDEFLDWMLKEKAVLTDANGEVVEDFLLSGTANLRDNYDKMVSYAYSEAEGVGAKIGNFIKAADTELDATSIKNQLLKSLETNIDEMDGVTAKAIKSVQEEIMNTPGLQGEFVSLSKLQKIKSNMSKNINFEGVSGSKGLQQQRRVAVDNLTRMIEDTVESKLDDAALASFQKAKGDYRKALTAMDLMEGEALKETGLMGALKETVSLSGGISGGLGFALGGPAGAALGIAANRLIKDTTLPASAARVLNSNAFNKLVTGIRAGIPKYEALGRKITAASGRSIDAFSHTFQASLGQVSLEEAPLQRTSDAAYKRAHEIIPLVRDLDPTMADALEDAVLNEDIDMFGSIIHGLSNQPRARKLIQPGIGWDGRAISEEEIGMIRTKIEQSDLPFSVKLEMLTQFDKDRIIPDIASLEGTIVRANKQDALKPREGGRKVEVY